MSTKKASSKVAPDEMRPEYDLRGGVRGMFFAEHLKGTNDPDVPKAAKTIKRTKNRE